MNRTYLNKTINPFTEHAVIERHELNLLLQLSISSLKFYVYILMVKIPHHRAFFELRDVEIQDMFRNYRAFKDAMKDLIKFNIIDVKSDKLNQYWINYKFFTNDGYYHPIDQSSY